MDNATTRNKDLAKRFVARQLSANELAEVNLKIENDESFAKEVAFYVALKKSFAQTETSDSHQASTDKVIPTTYWKCIAASAAIGLMVFAFWFSQPKIDNQQKATISIAELSTLSESTPQKSTMGFADEVNRLIRENQYLSALPLLEKQWETAKDKCLNNQINYQLGLIQLYHKDGETAARAVAPLKCIYDLYPEAYPRIQIHLARAYAWSGDVEKAKEILQNISADLPDDLKKI